LWIVSGFAPPTLIEMLADGGVFVVNAVPSVTVTPGTQSYILVTVLPAFGAKCAPPSLNTRSARRFRTATPKVSDLRQQLVDNVTTAPHQDVEASDLRRRQLREIRDDLPVGEAWAETGSLLDRHRRRAPGRRKPHPDYVPSPMCDWAAPVNVGSSHQRP
jgi:hypothetical protein